MRTVDHDEPEPALGKPYRPEPAAPVEPTWKPMPGHPDHETDGKGVRLKLSKTTISIWDLYGLPRPGP